MYKWRERLKHDPIEPLLNSGNKAIGFYAKRDLLREDVGPVKILWCLHEPKRILRNQRGDGSWHPPEKSEKYPAVGYGLIETFKHFRELVGKYEFDRTLPAIEAAAEYVLTRQSFEGDFRGFYADQYAPHYTGLLIELLVKAGYGWDPRVEEAVRWLLKVRQGDGGWVYPGLTGGLTWKEEAFISSHYAETLRFDPRHPSSHNITGMALRGLACHPEYAHSAEARRAGELLASRFLRPDAYTSYSAADNWVRFQYPYWWNNLVMALDSMSRIGFTTDNPQVKRGMDWFVEHQSGDGLWENSYRNGAKKIETEKAQDDRLWVTFAICRVFSRLENEC